MDEKNRNHRNAKRRERYRNDTDYRDKVKAQSQRYYSENRELKKARLQERYANDSEYRARHAAKERAAELKRKYGLSLQDFGELLARQNHACGICERPFHETPHVDHCHITRWVRGLLCGKCNRGLGHFEDNPVFLVKAARYTARWLLHVLQILNRKENDMTTTDDSGPLPNPPPLAGEGREGERMMRKAILHELHQPFGIDPPEPADHLQAVARALVIKAVAHDVSAIKEILDRIDGKTPSTPANNDLQQLVNLSWKLPESPSELSPSKMPRSKKCKSTTGRARNSSPSTDEPNGSPAS
jgi:hypothetical protein